MVAGPLQLDIPSSATAPPAADPLTESNLFQSPTTGEITTTEEVNAEMHLMLHPRAGLLLHSNYNYLHKLELN